MRLRELAAARPRFGYKRLTGLLRRDGYLINHKRVWRLYQEEFLCVRRKRRKKLVAQPRLKPLPAGDVDAVWSMDFMQDSLRDGSRIRLFNVIDNFSREALDVRVAKSFPSKDVTEVLDEVIALRGRPKSLRMDNGSEFTSIHFDCWARDHGIDLDFITPGKPTENSLIASSNGKVRDECLNTQWFNSLAEDRERLEEWRDDYNNTRPHSSSGSRRLPRTWQASWELEADGEF